MSEESYLRTLARFHHDVRTGAINFDYRTGACGPGPQALVRSWGAACPPGGICTPDSLPAALNRYFAGDRNGCREIPYSFKAPATTSSTTVNVAVQLAGTFKVTMCPTRLLVIADGAHNQWEISSLKFGNQNEIVGGPVGANVFDPRNFNQTVPMVPDCMRAGQPYEFNLILKPEAMATARNIYLVFIGPMVG